MTLTNPGTTQTTNFKQGTGLLAGGSSAGQGKVNYTLKQLKEIILDIYALKEKHDDKCINVYH